MSERYFISLCYPNYHYCTVAVVGNEGFVDLCTDEYEMKLYLQRHQLVYNLGRAHIKLKEVKTEINRSEHLHKSTDNLRKLYKELCVIFYEYYER